MPTSVMTTVITTMIAIVTKTMIMQLQMIMITMVIIYNKLGRCRVSLFSPDHFDTNQQRKMVNGPHVSDTPTQPLLHALLHPLSGS